MSDSDAFLFSIDKNTKYPVQDAGCAMYSVANGFIFGCNELEVRSDGKLNEQNEGYSYQGRSYYKLPADENGKSPLTGVDGSFTVAELEVYQVLA